MPSTVLLPALPLRDIVAFPSMTLPLLVGRAKSLKACEETLAGDRQILLIAQRNQAVDVPSSGDLYPVGVIAKVFEHLALPDSRMKLLVRGVQRAKLLELTNDDGFAATVEPMESAETPQASDQWQFRLAEWTASAKPRKDIRVAELQHLLENETLNADERLNAVAKLIGFNR